MQAQFHSHPSGQQQPQLSSENAQFQQQPPPTMHTLRLRDNSTVTTATRSSRKRKAAEPPPADQQSQPPLPPPHSLIHPPPHMPNISTYPYGPGPVDYTPGGMPPPHPMPPPPPGDQQQSPTAGDSGQDQDHDSQSNKGNRPLTQSKRAEQNRKAQRAFRERRDAHVKALESRSQLLDSALASADEANRRWEECRALVDQLRIENAALRAALNQAQMMQGGTHLPPPPPPVHLPPHMTAQIPNQSQRGPSIDDTNRRRDNHNEKEKPGGDNNRP